MDRQPSKQLAHDLSVTIITTVCAFLYAFYLQKMTTTAEKQAVTIHWTDLSVTRLEYSLYKEESKADLESSQ